MSVVSKLMLRFGWIRLSSYGLEIDMDGRLVAATQMSGNSPLDTSWTNVLPAPVDPASCFDPSLAAPAVASPVAPPPLPPSPAPAEEAQIVSAEPATTPDDEDQDEDERAWQAAVARAKAASEAEQANASTEQATGQTGASESGTQGEGEDLGFADTAPLPDQKPAPKSEPQEQAETQVEDWESLVSAARHRAEVEEATAVAAQETTVVAEETRVERTDVTGAGDAQVEQGATAANDGMPADQVTSIHHLALRPLAAAAPDGVAPGDDEWTRLKAEVEQREREESQRKLRAMREIQRLQKRANMKNFVLPPRSTPTPARRRMAAGTTPSPIRPRPVPAQEAAPASAKAAHPETAAATTGLQPPSALPRVTTRLGRAAK